MTAKITIGITTYNLEKYIAQTLDSILSQKTDFPYQILIADDASTDSTRKILKDYQKTNPSIVHLILLSENVGSLAASNRLFDKIKTEYFSFIDGDDYWIDENRLQKQIDFLDQNPDHTMCGGNTLLAEDSEKRLLIKSKRLNRKYSFDDYLSKNCPFVHTSSLVLRNSIYNQGIPDEYIKAENSIFNCAYRGEDIRFMHHLEKGYLYIFPETFSVYRIHQSGLWQSSSELKQSIETAIANLNYLHIFHHYDCTIFRERLLNELQEIQKKLLRPHDTTNADFELKLLTDLYKKLYWCDENLFNNQTKHSPRNSHFLRRINHFLLRRQGGSS